MSMATDEIVNALLKASMPDDGQSGGALVYGTVENLSPLRIRLDSNLTIPEPLLLLSRFCKEKWTADETQHTHSVSVQDTYTGGGAAQTHPTTHRHLMWRGIIVGDKVSMIALNGGQMYYVIERTGDW